MKYIHKCLDKYLRKDAKLDPLDTHCSNGI